MTATGAKLTPGEYDVDPEFTEPAPALVHGVATVHTFTPLDACSPNCWHLVDTEHADHPGTDMSWRWRVTAAAHSMALAALADPALPEGTQAMVPLVMPGKEHGWWLVGQPVETIHDVVILATAGRTPAEDRPVPGKVLDYCAARTLAEHIAAAYLGDRAGTTAHACITADGTTFIHEAF